MYVQPLKKSTLSPFDDKRSYESNNKNKRWGQKSGVWMIIIRFCPLTFHFSTRRRQFRNL